MKFSIDAVKFDTPSYSLQSPLKKELGCPSYGTWKYGQMSVAWILPSLFPDPLLYFMWVKTMAWSHIPFGEGNGNPLQYSCLENPMDGGAWEAAVHGVLKSPTEQLHFHFSLSCIGEGNDNPFQCSCLENPRDGGAWWAAISGVTQSRIRLKWLSSSKVSLHRHFPCWQFASDINLCTVKVLHNVDDSRHISVN